MLQLNVAFCLFLSILQLLQIDGTTITRSDVSRDPRIINGTAAKINSTKHQVSIRYRYEDDEYFGMGHSCGGSLISNNVALTAAHCFLGGFFQYFPDEYFVVVMGNLDRFENNSNTLRFDIARTIKGSFNFGFNDDIALVILNGTVPANHPTVQPIVLNDGPLESNTICQATGWGITEEDKFSNHLRTVDLPLIATNDCRYKTEYKSRIGDGMICAGYLEGGRDACQADSGGPLVCHGVQAGIISWGLGCGQPLYPGVYTNISYYKNWILEKLANYNTSLPKFVAVKRT